jgi:hypothetical protein
MRYGMKRADARRSHRTRAHDAALATIAMLTARIQHPLLALTHKRGTPLCPPPCRVPTLTPCEGGRTTGMQARQAPHRPRGAHNQFDNRKRVVPPCGVPRTVRHAATTRRAVASTRCAPARGDAHAHARASRKRGRDTVAHPHPHNHIEARKTRDGECGARRRLPQRTTLDTRGEGDSDAHEVARTYEQK